MSKEDIISRMADAGLKTPARGDFIFIHWDQIAMLLDHQRNAVLDEIADKIALMPFGDTAASFAVWIKEQKT